MALLSLQDVSARFGGPWLLDGATLNIERGERVCLLGRNGEGKSTLLKIAAGRLAPDAGEVSIAPTVEFNCIDQSRIELDPEKTVADEISEGVDTVQLGTEKISVWGYLKRFLFEDDTMLGYELDES